jgi:hypothetical protein
MGALAGLARVSRPNQAVRRRVTAATTEDDPDRVAQRPLLRMTNQRPHCNVTLIYLPFPPSQATPPGLRLRQVMSHGPGSSGDLGDKP